MFRKIVSTEDAPRAIGPYSQAIIVYPLIFTAGQLGIDPKTGELVNERVAAQTRQAMRNIKAILEAGGSSIDHVVKTTIFLVDMNDFSTVNSVYAEFFSGSPPARSTVQVAALPKGGLVEIEAIAMLTGVEQAENRKNLLLMMG